MAALETPVSTGVAVLVNGLPGAGKTTLSGALASQLRLPLLSQDMIKEIHADVLGSNAAAHAQQKWNAALGRAASQTMWSLLSCAPAGAVLESSWRADVRSVVVQGLALAPHVRPVEVWCEVPLDVARSRLEARRPRPGVNGELPSDAEWGAWSELARPLEVGPLLCVDTSSSVDARAVVSWILETMGEADVG